MPEVKEVIDVLLFTLQQVETASAGPEHCDEHHNLYSVWGNRAHSPGL